VPHYHASTITLLIKAPVNSYSVQYRLVACVALIINLIFMTMILLITCAIVALVALLYYRANRSVTNFINSLESYEYVEDPTAELFWGSGIYRLSADQSRIVDSETGGSFLATRDEVVDIKRITRHGALTCDTCLKHSCPFRGDEYNRDGDCLASK
jgi:hypothetical protein